MVDILNGLCGHDVRKVVVVEHKHAQGAAPIPSHDMEEMIAAILEKIKRVEVAIQKTVQQVYIHLPSFK